MAAAFWMHFWHFSQVNLHFNTKHHMYASSDAAGNSQGLQNRIEKAGKSENLTKGLLHIPQWLVFSPPLKFHLGMLKAT